MATLVKKTIGTGGDYADWDAFIAACPTDLVALNEQWRVEFKNQVHSRTTGFTFTTARTTSAECYFEFTAETGGAWCDASNVRSKPLKFDSTFGATLSSSTTGGSILNISVSYTRINRLQIEATTDSTSCQPSLRVNSTATNVDANQLLLRGYAQNNLAKGVANISGSTNYLRNSLIVQRSTSTSAIIASIGTSAKAVNCTFVALNVKVAVGIEGSATFLRNCAVFNVTSPESTSSITKTNCFTDATATGWTTAQYSTATFISVDPTAQDFRLPAGSALIDAGTAEPVYGNVDATGIARPQGAGAAYDVGAWEYTASGGGTTPPAGGDTTAPILESPTGTATGSSTASGTVATNEAGGLLYFLVSPNATESAATIRNGLSQDVGATGTQNVSVIGLASQSTYRLHYVQVDAAGNQSNVVSSAPFTTSAPTSGTITTPPLVNAMGALHANLTGIAVSVMDGTTLSQIVSITNETTDAAGICTLSHASIVAGTTYAVAIRTGAGLLGIDFVKAT